MLGELDTLSVDAGGTLLAAPQLFPLSLLKEDGHPAAAMDASRVVSGNIGQIVLASTLGYSTWYWLNQRYNLKYLLTLLTSVFGVLASVVTLSETFSPIMPSVGAVANAGVAIVILRRPNVPHAGG